MSSVVYLGLFIIRYFCGNGVMGHDLETAA